VRPIVAHWLGHYLGPDAASALAPTWFMCVGFAGLAGLVVMLVLARRRGIESGTVASAMLWGYIAAVTAGIVVPMTIEAIAHLFATGHVQFRWAGMTSFWGYLAGAAAVAAVCKAEHVPLAKMADLSAIPIGVALVFARLGCFMAGCDYGKVSSLPWAVRFPAGSPAWHDQLRAGLIPAGRLESLPVHPTQLYEAALGILIVFVAWIVTHRPRREGRADGRAFMAAAATYAIGRLMIECVRGDVGRGIYFGLSSGQIFSLLVLLALAARYTLTRRLVTIAAMIALVGKVHAQPAPDLDATGSDAGSNWLPADTADAPQDPAEPPPIDNTRTADLADAPPFVSPGSGVPEPVAPLRPIFAVGFLLGGATSVNRPGEQVPDLSGESLSLGYIPGRFGLWLDLDRFTNSEAAHSTAIASVSFAPRVTPHLWIGARAGVGVTHVNFMNDGFSDVTASTVRLEAIAEVVMNHNWAVWVRPFSVDVLSAGELGGAITTFQFRAGIAYRFGERGHLFSPPPAAPPPPQPRLQPTLEAP
jgi:prolipoprotein diacylglyceryltransferase